MQAAARAQPNIALIKYWGKRDTARNLPAVGSISVTLADLYTDMTVELEDGRGEDSLTVNDVAAPDLLPRVSLCLDSVLGDGRPAAVVRSSSNFPIAAGLASSASAFAALVVAATEAGARDFSQEELANLAGRTSGSAARSLFGGIVELHNDHDRVRIDTLLAAEDWPLRVVIAVTEPGRKAVSSGEAMEISRKTSPHYQRWLADQAYDLTVARDAVAARDFNRLGQIAEHNCLKMHTLMWASQPPMVYWNEATLACLYTVRDLQAAASPVFFTVDAGPQVKVICLDENEAAVRDALASTPGVSDVLVSGLGEGARPVTVS